MFAALNTILFSYACLWTSYKWNHTVCILCSDVIVSPCIAEGCTGWQTTEVFPYQLLVTCCLSDSPTFPCVLSWDLFKSLHLPKGITSGQAGGSWDPAPTLHLGPLLTGQSLCQLVVKYFTLRLVHVVECSWNFSILLNYSILIKWMYFSLSILLLTNI